jgi:prevent-host-death family protein
MNDSLDATYLSLTEDHPDLVDTLKHVASGRPIILHQNGKKVAALISIEDLHLLERLVEEEEDRIELVALLNQGMV